MRISKERLLGLSEAVVPIGTFDPGRELWDNLSKNNIGQELGKQANWFWNTMAKNTRDFEDAIRNFRIPGPNTPVRFISTPSTTTAAPAPTEKKFESPLYGAGSQSLFKPMATVTKTVTPQGGDYTTSYTATPTVQQRLKLSGEAEGDVSLSRKERGVPLDKSSELMGSYERSAGGKWIPYSNTVVNPNLAREKLKASTLPFTSMYNVSTTYTGKRWVPDEEED